MIFLLKKRDSVKNTMISQKLLSVNQIFNLEVGKFMQRLALEIIPIPFLSMFSDQERVSERETRSASIYFQPHTSKSKCKQSIRFTGPLIWNAIPNAVKKSTNEMLDNRVFVRNSEQLDRNATWLPTKTFAKKMKAHALQNIDFI